MTETPKRAYPHQVLQAVRRGDHAGDYASLIAQVAGEDLQALSWMLLGAEIVTDADDKRVSHAYDLTQARMAEVETREQDEHDGPGDRPHVLRVSAAAPSY